VTSDAITYLGVEPQAPREQMIPLATDQTAWRHYSIDGDTLRLWQTDADFQPVATLTFRRQ
jgi:hypothetical protein